MTKKFFRIEMLPAKHGDSLLVEYGQDRIRRILIDGGPLNAYPTIERRLREIPLGDQSVELLVITHVDRDHIEGIIRLMAMPKVRWPIHVEQIWFNGWRHIKEANDLGGVEGEFMSALIHQRANECWNTAFGQKAVCCGTNTSDMVTLAEDMTLTIISPDATALAELQQDWEDKVDTKGIDPGDYEDAWSALVEENKFHPGAELTLGPEDLTAKLRKLLGRGSVTTANGSSIGFIAEFSGKSCMFLGDAKMGVVCGSLRGLGYSETNPVKVDAVKVSHHGSKNNITPEFLALVDARNWLFSSNGDLHNHPDVETVEAVIKGSISTPSLWFNYRSPFTEKWEKGADLPSARYRAYYPAEGEEGIVIEL